METVFWAGANGNYDISIASYTPRMQKVAQEDKAQFAANQPKKFASFKGMQIVARKDVAKDKVELRYFFEFQQRGEHVVTMVKIGDAWKCDDKTAYTTNWDEGSQPEPQP